jgi:AraC-like DNA-binding protein
MDTHPENLSVCPFVIDTKTSGFAPDPVATLEQTLEFSFFEGCDARHAFPHTTGWRTLPFSVLSALLENEAVTHLDGYGDIAMKPGDAVLIPTGVRHKSDANSACGVRALWMHFTFRVLGGLDLFRLVSSPGRISGEMAEEGRAAMREVIRHHSAPVGHPLAVMAARRQAEGRLLQFLLGVCPPRPGMEERIACSHRLKRVLDHIHEHYADPLSRDDFHRLACLSRSRFHTLFREVTGMAPMEYVKHRRLQVAQTALLTTDASVKEIAHAVGYGDAFHFTRLFTAAVGCCPREFRRRNLT